MISRVDPALGILVGDDGPWARHLSAAWQLSCGDLAATPPPDPSPPFGWVDPNMTSVPEGAFEDLLAFWTPLVHLVGYGLGWAYPERGLARWFIARGRVQDPLLVTISRWWGRRRIADFLLWGGFEGGLPLAGRPLCDAVQWSTVEDRARREAPDWQLVWATGSDPMHLTGHVNTPVAPPAGHSTLDLKPEYVNGHPTGRMRGLLTRELYEGWYADLDERAHQCAVPLEELAIDVHVDSIGFLGTYRRHQMSGRWYRGRSDVHLWGN